jgi:hypothetical protein
LIRIRHNRDDANDPLRVTIWNSDEPTSFGFKLYNWNNLFSIDTWAHVVVTWDGTDLLLYFDGSSEIPDTTPIDDSGTMTNASRNIAYGSIGTSSPPGVTWEGLVGPLAIWDVAIDADNVAEIFNPGGAVAPFDFDLETNSGGYNESSNLIHWYRASQLTIGDKDRVGSIDFDDTTGIDIGDTSTDVPS